ncbi:hypothetical protein Taro_034452 [Colocasia esculenta]|uniref:Uncharacterized protein n=1 Tax=Colocasia esculenta TaxID=4460 RepID=A0A843WBZ2_COLES|nr:hypothetical protein [Colocasia esculenta]
MDLQLCGLQVWCWLVSTVLWLVILERQLDLSFVIARLRGTNISSKSSVDTPHTGVDTMLQALSQKIKKWSSSVDTRPSQVDTRGRS